MVYERIEKLCIENGTNITALCREITGSTGNISTWKKDKIWPSALKAICTRFKISSDDLLEIPNWTKSNIPRDEEFMELIHGLPSEQRWELRGYIKRMVEETGKKESVAADSEDIPERIAAK